MDQKPTEPEETQETPKGHKIPVPTKADVLADLKKVAKPPKRSRLGRSKKKR